MIISSSLLSTPLLSCTDTTRLQMSAKQLSQSLTHPNCEIPKIIGNNWRYLTATSPHYIQFADSDGIVHYINDFLMIVEYYNSETPIHVYDISSVKPTTSYYAVTLRYRRDIGPFKKGDILFEYDSFNGGVPSYGYNWLTLFASWFGWTHEDSYVISERAAEQCKATKYDKIIIPITETSLFKNLYPDSRFKFIPEIGQTINGYIVYQSIEPRKTLSDINLIKIIKENELKNLATNTSMFKLNFRLRSKVSKIENGKIVDIKIHRVKKRKILNPELNEIIRLLEENYYSRVKIDLENITNLFGIQYAKQIATSYYTYLNVKKGINAAYLIELTIAKTHSCEVGDKLANRYAGKGVVSLIMPDDLCPQVLYPDNKFHQCDVIFNSIGVFSRMNFGQILEALLSDIVIESEKQILNNNISSTLLKLSGLARIFEDNRYAQKIAVMSESISQDPVLADIFKRDVSQRGLYFEVPNFTKTNLEKIISFMKTRFNLEPYKKVRISRKCLQFMKDKLRLENIPIPNEDYIYLDHMFCGHVYILKLKQEAKALLSARDFGIYKATNKQPLQGKNIAGTNTASKIGQMEMDAILAQGLLNTLKEIRTVKNDMRSMKSDLVSQFLSKGFYKMPEVNNQSYIKTIINTLIEFINHKPSSCRTLD